MIEKNMVYSSYKIKKAEKAEKIKMKRNKMRSTMMTAKYHHQTMFIELTRE